MAKDGEGRGDGDRGGRRGRKRGGLVGAATKLLQSALGCGSRAADDGMGSTLRGARPLPKKMAVS